MIYFQKKYVVRMIIRAYTLECGEVQVAPPLARKRYHGESPSRLMRPPCKT